MNAWPSFSHFVLIILLFLELSTASHGLPQQLRVCSVVMVRIYAVIFYLLIANVPISV